MLVQTGSNPVIISRPEAIVANVLFACPDKFEWIFYLPGKRHCLFDRIRLEASAKSTADQLVVNDNFLGFMPGDLGRQQLRNDRCLGSDPDIETVGAHMNRSVDRLHRGMRKER